MITNNPVVNLTLAASGVDLMSFSSNGVTYAAPEAYATGKAWTLSAGDGIKTLFVRFHDTANSLTYDQITAQITLDTVAPVTSVSPATGTFDGTVTVVISVNEQNATIKYTTDGTDPKISGSAVIYAGPVSIPATTSLKYYATDVAGNAEAVRSELYTIHDADLSLSNFTINGGASLATSTAVTLTIDAVDPLGIATMQFSNDGVTFSDEESYATTKSWNLIAGDGKKTVYVRLRDKSLPAGHLYGPYAATINFAAKDGLYPGTTGYLNSALLALQIANGLATPGVLDLAHCDVAPYVNGAAKADGKIDLLDVYVIMSRMVGLITSF